MSESVRTSLVIDTDKNPFVPEQLKLKKHEPHGELIWTPTLVLACPAHNQEVGYNQYTHIRRIHAENQKVVNASVLEFLQKDPGLIPPEWAGKNVFFWGTVYEDEKRDIWVRFIRSTTFTNGDMGFGRWAFSWRRVQRGNQLEPNVAHFNAVFA